MAYYRNARQEFRDGRVDAGSAQRPRKLTSAWNCMSYIKAGTSRIEDATEKRLVWVCSMNWIAQQFWSVLGTFPHGFCQVRSLL
jgi:hypothetical protein